MLLSATNYEKTNLIYLKRQVRDELVRHCLRKLSGDFLVGETQEKQAYGLLGGQVRNNDIYVSKLFCCRSNFRNSPGIGEHMNRLVDTYAIPAKTPIHQRGWVIQPEELLEAYDNFDKSGLELIGSYHMHHSTSWEGDEPKEYPSQFDAKLAENSGMIMFIASITSELSHVKAFYNGLKGKEIKVTIDDVE